MDPVKGAASLQLPVEAASTVVTTQATANIPAPLHASSLTLANLGPRSFEELNELEHQGDERKKNLAKLVKDSMQSGFLSLGPNQQQPLIAQYGRKVNNTTLVICAKQNEISQYEILSVGIRHTSGKTISMVFPKVSDNTERRKAAADEPSIYRLPQELKRRIMGEILSSENKRQAVYDLTSFVASNHHLEGVLNHDVLLKPDLDARKKIIGAVNSSAIRHLAQFVNTPLFMLASQQKRETCFDYILNYATDEEHIKSLGNALEFLTEGQRSHYVNNYLDLDSRNDPDLDSAVGGIIGSMGSGLHTIPKHHSELVEAVLDMGDVGKSFAIRGLGKGLGALDEALQDMLVQATLDLEGESNLSNAIRGVCDGFSAISTGQRDAVFNSSLLVTNELDFTYKIVNGLSEVLHVLKPKQQLDLADAVSAMRGESEKSFALQYMGKALTRVSGSQYVELLSRLSNAALSMRSEKDRAIAVAGLGQGLHPGPGLDNLVSTHAQLIQQLIDETLAMNNEPNKSLAIAGLGGGLQALTSEQKGNVLNIGLGMRNEANRSHVIGGVGVAMSALTFEQRDNVVNTCLSINDSKCKSIAIQGLGAGLDALTPAQRARLVDAAITLPDEHKLEAIAALRTVKEPQQFLRLVEAALSLTTDGSEPDIGEQLSTLSELAHRHVAAGIGH